MATIGGFIIPVFYPGPFQRRSANSFPAVQAIHFVCANVEFELREHGPYFALRASVEVISWCDPLSLNGFPRSLGG